MIQKQKLSILLPVLLLLMGTQSCTFDANAIRGDGNVVTREKSLDSFSEIDASGVFKIFLLEGENPHIRIETDENIHEYISYKVRNNTLELSMQSNQIYRPTRLHAYITVNALEKIRMSGATSLEADHVIVSPEFSLHLSGAGDIDLEVETEKLTTHVSGAGSLKIKGYANMHDITLSGAASLKCVDLITQVTHIRLSGAGSANVYASEELNASISGVGSIRYAGEPQSKNISRSGVGSIRPI